MTFDEARLRLARLGFDPPAVDVLVAHFEDAERRGKRGHGLSRVEWLETLELDPGARPERLVAEESFERWDARGALGYLVLDEIVRATLDSPPARARLVVAERCFPTGALGYWVRRLAEGGLVAAADGDVTEAAPAPGRRPGPHRNEPDRHRRALV